MDGIMSVLEANFWGFFGLGFFGLLRVLIVFWLGACFHFGFMIGVRQGSGSYREGTRCFSFFDLARAAETENSSLS